MRAAARDLLGALPPLVIAGAAALTWLLARTAWGRDDVRDVDSAIALAIVASAPAAWIAGAAVSLATSRATPGQHAVGLLLRGADEASREWWPLWLAFHPLYGTAGWAWAAGVVALTTSFRAAAAIGGVAVIVALGGLVSLVLVVGTRDGRALHDRLVRARVTR